MLTLTKIAVISLLQSNFVSFLTACEQKNRDFYTSRRLREENFRRGWTGVVRQAWLEVALTPHQELYLLEEIGALHPLLVLDAQRTRRLYATYRATKATTIGQNEPMQRIAVVEFLVIILLQPLLITRAQLLIASHKV